MTKCQQWLYQAMRTSTQRLRMAAQMRFVDLTSAAYINEERGWVGKSNGDNSSHQARFLLQNKQVVDCLFQLTRVLLDRLDILRNFGGNLQEPHQMSALIISQPRLSNESRSSGTRKLRTQPTNNRRKGEQIYENLQLQTTNRVQWRETRNQSNENPDTS